MLYMHVVTGPQRDATTSLNRSLPTKLAPVASALALVPEVTIPPDQVDFPSASRGPEQPDRAHSSIGELHPIDRVTRRHPTKLDRNGAPFHSTASCPRR